MPTPDHQKKALHLNGQFELKALDRGEFEGYGSTFGNVDLGGDVVAPGAFKSTLADHGKAGTLPQMFWMHNPSEVPGKWTVMQEDSKGLYVKGILADTSLGNDMRELLMIKAVRGLSIGFSITDRRADVTYTDEARILKKIDLWEVSLVSLAMNPLAAVSGAKARLSHEGEYVPTERELEQHLRDAGCSKRVARSIVARLYDDDSSGGMLDGSHGWDARDVDHEADLARSLDRMTDAMAAEIFRR